MSEKQPPTVVEGATAGDVEEEVQPAKSAEDRKAASALASLDAGGDDSGSGQVDVDAAQKAIKGLGGATAAKKEVKNVKVDAADVALLVSQPTHLIHTTEAGQEMGIQIMRGDQDLANVGNETKICADEDIG